jgi:hypothetical protein
MGHHCVTHDTLTFHKEKAMANLDLKFMAMKSYDQFFSSKRKGREYKALDPYTGLFKLPEEEGPGYSVDTLSHWKYDKQTQSHKKLEPPKRTRFATITPSPTKEGNALFMLCKDIHPGSNGDKNLLMRCIGGCVWSNVSKRNKHKVRFGEHGWSYADSVPVTAGFKFDWGEGYTSRAIPAVEDVLTAVNRTESKTALNYIKRVMRLMMTTYALGGYAELGSWWQQREDAQAYLALGIVEDEEHISRLAEYAYTYADHKMSRVADWDYVYNRDTGMSVRVDVPPHVVQQKTRDRLRRNAENWMKKTLYPMYGAIIETAE